MTIKISSIQTTTGEILLVIAYDNPSGSGTMYSYSLPYQDLKARLAQVAELLGRTVTLTDAQQAIVAIINEVRSNQAGIPQTFDFTSSIGVELET
jgi:hypothetical protein